MSKILKKIKILFGGSDVFVFDASAVSSIAKMQKDLDAYDFAFTNIIGYLNGKFGDRRIPAIRTKIAHTDERNSLIEMIFQAAIDLRTKYEKLKKENDKLKWEYEVHNRD